MTVTIVEHDHFIDKKWTYEGIDFNRVSFKQIKKRNGVVLEEIRIENGNRDIVVTAYGSKTVTVQDEETGKYIYRYNG